MCDSELWLMLLPSRFVRPSPALHRFMRVHGLEAGDDLLVSALELCDMLHRTFDYAPGSTAADSPIESILETGCGVCQEHIIPIDCDAAYNSGDDERHIRVAVGRDYADVPPTRGVYKGWAESVLTPEVTVARQEM